MSLFRHSLDPAEAQARPARPEDHGSLARLLAIGRRRFLGAPSAALPSLLGAEPGAALVSGAELWALAVCERSAPETAWLRALAMADLLPAEAGLDALLAAYHAELRGAGVRRAFFSGNDAADAWLRLALLQRGYARHTEVVVYEKIRMNAPTAGNPSVSVRRAAPADLPAILALDAACFEAQWHKDKQAIGPALASSPCFLVAEQARTPVGYAFVTSHYEGRLVHLVRIAVLPAHQGQGVGARLLAEVVGFARSSGADTLTLNTQSDNHTARRLYEHFGFRRTGERQTVLVFEL
ncbi:MAG: hypothetical protein RLZZ387_2002 [Chloroflexota bacterium]|jgi:ribosomal protein S18 acetylase RimI-like enzyme